MARCWSAAGTIGIGVWDCRVSFSCVPKSGEAGAGFGCQSAPRRAGDGYEAVRPRQGGVNQAGDHAAVESRASTTGPSGRSIATSQSPTPRPTRAVQRRHAPPRTAGPAGPQSPPRRPRGRLWPSRDRQCASGCGRWCGSRSSARSPPRSRRRRTVRPLEAWSGLGAGELGEDGVVQRPGWEKLTITWAALTGPTPRRSFRPQRGR